MMEEYVQVEVMNTTKGYNNCKSAHLSAMITEKETA